MNTKGMLKASLEIRKNVANLLPFYHQYNVYLFNRRYKKGLAPWCEISDGLCNRLSKLREEAVALAPQGRILEIGWGNGELTSRLSRDSREVIGLDISIEAIKRAKKHERGNLKFFVHNIVRNPLRGKIVLLCAEMCSIMFPSFR
jgi:2-polyprenyl-3-methyl-5-hydroxy-6-metoxy-1,4-benzoquinol methylase